MTTLDLHVQHWRYVRRILPRYGIPASDVPDVAQEVWITVHLRLHTYDPAIHRSWRAWITGIVRRCAANHRRSSGRLDSLPEGAAMPLPAPGLSAELLAVLSSVLRTFPNNDARDALLLQLDGLSVDEIAAIQGVTPDAVEKRLRMARHHLKGDGEKRAGAFLGFGTFEALAEAMRPKDDLPDEVGEQEWERIAEAIRLLEGAPASEGPPSSSFPPPPLVPALPAATSGLVVVGRAKLWIVLGAIFLAGAGAGAGAVWAWWTLRTPRGAPAVQAPSSTSTLCAEPPVAPSSAPAPPPSSSARPAVVWTTPAPASTPAAASPDAGNASSMRLLMQIDRALERKRLANALQLVERHARLFGDRDRDEREAARARALRGLAQEAGSSR